MPGRERGLTRGREHAWKRCPNCGGERFFIDTPPSGIAFLRFDGAGSLFNTAEPPLARPELAACLTESRAGGRSDGPVRPAAPIHCINCGWCGAPHELTPPPDSGEAEPKDPA